MKKKFIALLAVSFLAASAFGASEKDTVYVNNSGSVDTLLINDGTSFQSVDTVNVSNCNANVYIHENRFGDVSVWTSKRNSYNKFKSHLSGVYLGINTYYNNKWKMDLPSGYEDMDLDLSKSINFGINFGSISQPIFGKYFGVSAAIGTEWHNYRFNENITLARDKNIRAVVVEYIPDNVNVLKSKLTDWWLNVPVAFEYNGGKYHSFYASVGAVGSILLNSHTKVVTKEDGDKNKDKVWNKFYLNPFRVSLMAKVGYANFGVYANYSLIQMFQDGKGPELYPFSAGVTFNF